MTDEADEAIDTFAELARQNAELRAEVERLTQERNAESARYDAAMETLKVVRQDQEHALAEVERLKASQQHCHCDADIIRNRDAEIERLRGLIRTAQKAEDTTLNSPSSAV